jgi:PAS domain-containing protein/stage II sporulation SpoE-like protein
VQILNYRKDGTPFWNRLSVTPVRSPSGQVTHHIGVQSDITAQKNAEDALREAKQKLETANSRILSPAPGRSAVYEDAQGTRPATPSQVAAKLNEYFPFDTRTAQYFTLVYGLLDLKARTFRYVAAGHRSSSPKTTLLSNWTPTARRSVFSRRRITKAVWLNSRPATELCSAPTALAECRWRKASAH